MMKALRIVLPIGLLIGSWIAIPGCSGRPELPTTAQTTSPKQTQPPTPNYRIELRSLTGEDARREGELEKAIFAAWAADRWDESVAASEERLALRMRVLGPKHFNTVNAEWFRETCRRVARMKHDDRVAYLSARTMHVKALALDAQGKYAQAQPLFEKALEINRRPLTDAHPATAGSYNHLATNLQGQGKYTQAQPLYEKALEIKRRLLTDDHPATAAGYNNLANNIADQGKHAQAQPFFEKGLEITRRLVGDDHPRTAVSYNNLGTNLGAQGKYAQAQPLLEKALEINRRSLTDDHPATAGSYNNVAMNLNSQGKYAEAQPLLQKALAIYRRLLTDEHPDTARSYNNLAINLNAQRKYAQAQPLYEKALDIWRRLLTVDHPDTATSYNNVAYNLSAQGKYAQAQPLYEKGLEIRRRVFTDDHRDTAESYNHVAANLAAQGKYAEAQPLHESALEMFRRLQTDDHPDTAWGYYNVAANLNAQGEYPEARDRFQSAVGSMDAARLHIAFTGLERASMAKFSARPALAAVLARLGQPAEAWQSLEEDLGRGLLDELFARQDQRLAPAERARLSELTAALERLDKLVDAIPRRVDRGERAKRFEELKRQRASASIALGEFQTKLVQAYGALAGQVASLNEIQAALPADAALVAWVDLPPLGPNAADPDGDHWGVVVRSKGVPAWIPTPGTGPDGLWTKDDNTLVGRIRTELRSQPGASSADLRSLVERLRTQRLTPLAKALGATPDGLPPARRLIVLPSAAMAGIPIDALLTPDDTRIVSYTPSATVFKFLRERPRPDRHAGLLALGDPICLPPLPGTRYEVKALDRLFQAGGRPTRILLGAAASEQAMDRLASSGELGRFGFIHLATHGLMDEDLPARSAVILTQTGLPDPLKQALSHQPVFDGRLSVREIQRGWNLKAELVTLSACETALGRDAGGEGFVGFTQALLMSGTRTVCLSLWSVSDAATALLMQRFYANLLGQRPGLAGPLPKAEALREAKAWLRGLSRAELLALAAEPPGGAGRAKDAKARPQGDVPASADDDRPFAAPQFWAAFVLAGDPD
jgi:CHAT domain-containing protein/Tfp pilus assembly protein PilF